MNNKLIVGSVETCHLPEIGIQDLQIRVDTGATTSSLHADNIQTVLKETKKWVTFDIHPDIYNVEKVIHCEAPLYDTRNVKSSNGESEERHVIQTMLYLADRNWPIEITLTNRAVMKYQMLLGRSGMQDHILVDPSKTFLLETSEI